MNPDTQRNPSPIIRLYCFKGLFGTILVKAIIRSIRLIVQIRGAEIQKIFVMVIRINLFKGKIF
jgi:hypothetical protein